LSNATDARANHPYSSITRGLTSMTTNLSRDALATYAERTLGLAAGTYPFDSHWFEHEAARVHYIDEGQGPALFMLHGNPTWSFLYRKLVLALRDRFRCIVPDLPGFGLSLPGPGYDYRPESHHRVVRALIEHLDLGGITLIAHDWGGPIGLAVAQEAPHRFQRYVLGNTWAWPVNGIFHFEWFSRAMGGPIGRMTANRHNLFVNQVLPAAMRRGPLPPDVHQAYRAPFEHRQDWIGTHVFPACILGSREWLAGIEARLVLLPAERFLILWPDGDIAFQTRERARWRRLLPAAPVVDIPMCGHYLWEEAAEDVLAVLTRVLGTR